VTPRLRLSRVRLLLRPVTDPIDGFVGSAAGRGGPTSQELQAQSRAAEAAPHARPGAAGDGDRNSIENVSDAIRGRANLLLGRRDAAGQARAIEALYDEAERGVRA
jgi:hypothetical protein